jgi:ABC-type nitrate/sulfonate/bicarbonate transport system permease component
MTQGQRAASSIPPPPNPNTGIAVAQPLPKPPRWITTLRAEPPALLGKLLGVASIVLIVSTWYLLTAGAEYAITLQGSRLNWVFDPNSSVIISPAKLPSPAVVFGSYGELEDRDLFESIVATMARVVKGFTLAALVGVIFGTIAGSFRAAAAFFNPLALFGRSLPLAALIPITMLFFGIGEQQKIMFIFIASVPFIFSDTLKAITLVPERYVETAQTLGASRWQIIYKVLFPLALPEIVTSLRFLFGLALGYIMLAEAINAESGLGHMIIMGEKRSLDAQNYLLLIIIGLLAYLVDWTLRSFQRGIFPYRSDL